MNFPREFSARARAHVEAESIRAKQDLERLRAEQPGEEWKKGAREWDRYAFYQYILRVFLAFCSEACELGKEGTWTVDRVRSEAKEFLRRFTIEAYSENGRDRYGQKFPEMISNWGGALLPQFEQLFYKTDRWREFEDKLLAVAEEVAGGPDQAGEAPGDREVRLRSYDAVESKPTERGTIRQAFILPILERKGWTRGKWASEAGVGKNSVYGYLDGRRSLSPENRQAMAEVLDLLPEQLPE